MESNNRICFLFFVCIGAMSVSCESQPKYINPPGYDLSKPKRFLMPVELNEISGIAFNKGHPDTVYAEEDEDGKVYHFKLGSGPLQTTRFGKKGDFEDICISNNYVIMLRSDGVLFTFPFSETNNKYGGNVKEFSGLLPEGEYEGLASLDSAGKIFVLCKHCTEDKTSKRGGGSIFLLDANGNLTSNGNFVIKIKEIETIIGSDKINFHPSALTFNPWTREWFILSGVNKMLVITDENWEVKNVYLLNPSIYPQPEGIAFDRQRTLYISNERNKTPAATILEFDFRNK